MWQKAMRNSCLVFDKFFIVLSTCLLLSCSAGDGCNASDKLFGEPSCHKLKIASSSTFVGTKAACAGALSSRTISVSCPASAGTAQQCTSGSNGLPVFSLLVSNNAAGNFTDSNGATYTNCDDILNAYRAGTLINVAGVFNSDPANPAEQVSCNNATGCSMTSITCYAGWNSNTATVNGTASLPLASQYLTCTYIDTTSLGGNIPPAAVGAWAALPKQVTIGGNLVFNAGWVDAQ